ncbi:MAG: porin [Gemmatimonadota bacterium]
MTGWGGDRAVLLVGLVALAIGRPAASVAQETEIPGSGVAAADTVEATPPRVGHGDKGFEIESGDFLIQIQPRFQFRYAFPFDNDPDTNLEQGGDQQLFKLNRARMKIGGHAFSPSLKYFFEYELMAGALLDFRVMFEQWREVRFKVGQWKVHFNRERVISSGRQQLADRSIINRFFTVDRQQGVSVNGRLSAGGAADVSYWVSTFTGTGRAARENDDTALMWMGRLQWNLFGREVPFVGSDLGRSPPTGLIAVGAVTNRSPFTAFAQVGGLQLPGFEDGVAGQYRVKQATLETAFMSAGFAWQSELHWKEINDTVNGETTVLRGGYGQLGYFFAGLIDGFPPELEFAARYALLDDNREEFDDLRTEFALAANWFFSGHNNKLTAEIGVLTDENPIDSLDVDGTRFRVQWDVSF